MPSPLGHALGGIAAAWVADLVPGRRIGRTAPPGTSFFRRAGGGLTAACAVLAALPDADIVLGNHRTATHSLTAAFLVTIVSIGVTGWVTHRGPGPPRPRIPAVRAGLMCGGAYATHLLFDWLGIDRYPPSGLQLLWPFSQEWFISGLDLFPQTARQEIFSAYSIHANLTAVAWETALLLPVLVLLWLVRVKALARLSAELARGNHAA